MGPEKILEKVFTSKFICDHFLITITYKSIFTTGTSNWTTTLAVKLISRVTLPGNYPDSIKCSHFADII